eukprot:2719248-Lingulodinium_polyedra.AAC.1
MPALEKSLATLANAATLDSTVGISEHYWRSRMGTSPHIARMETSPNIACKWQAGRLTPSSRTSEAAPRA